MHLWEVDHPYYCSETNYFATADKTVTEYNSWRSFIEEWRDFDVDLNLIFRWDWRRPDPADYEDPDDVPPYDELALFRIGQRKGLFTCQLVRVSKDDETAVREYLQPHLDRLMENWYPLAPQERTIANGHCPECETFTLQRREDLPVCSTCGWTGWPEEE